MTALPENETPVGGRLGSERLYDADFPRPGPVPPLHPQLPEFDGIFRRHKRDKPEKPAKAAKQPPPPAAERPTAAKQATRNLRGPVSTALELAGIALVTAGCALIAIWLAFIVAGIALVVLGVATGLPVTK